MKYSILSFVTLLLITESINAQYLSEDELPMPERRNAIGLLLTAPTVSLMGGLMNDPAYALWYKRNVKPNKRIRMQVSYSNHYYEDNGLLTTILNVTDSSITYDWREETQYEVTAGAGLEWSNPLKKATPFYGVDLVVGYKSYSMDNRYLTFGLDTSVTSIYPDLQNMTASYAAQCYEHNTMSIRADFTIGWRIEAGERWEFNAFATPQIGYSFPVGETSCTATDFIPVSTSSLDFKLNILDLLLYYKF